MSEFILIVLVIGLSALCILFGFEIWLRNRDGK